MIAQLRELDESEFIRRVERQTHTGYELVGAFTAGAIIGVMGIRPVHTLVRGAHLHIDDLVVDRAHRRAGAGRALIEYAQSEALARGMTILLLNARREAISFYECLNFTLHSAPSMKKSLG